MLDLDPVTNPVCNRSINWKLPIPFDLKYKGLHHPRKKIEKNKISSSKIDQTINCFEIPKIIHQTWQDEDIPYELLGPIASWKALHPEFEFFLWTDETNRLFMKDFFPEFLEMYDSYTHNIQRTNTVKYFILFKLGGIFVDLDFDCLENIAPLVDGFSCVLSYEPKEHSKAAKKNVTVQLFVANMRLRASQSFVI